MRPEQISCNWCGAEDVILPATTARCHDCKTPIGIAWEDQTWFEVGRHLRRICERTGRTPGEVRGPERVANILGAIFDWMLENTKPTPANADLVRWVMAALERNVGLEPYDHKLYWLENEADLRDGNL